LELGVKDRKIHHHNLTCEFEVSSHSFESYGQCAGCKLV
jgi:hypothetical protein